VFDIMAGSEIVAGWDAAIGVSGGATVAQWNDLGSGGFNLIQVVAGDQPTFNAVGGPNGNPSVLFDGVDDYLMNAALDLSAPPFFFWGVLRQVSWSGTNDNFWSSQSSGGIVFQSGVSPNIQMFNGAAGPSSAGLSVNVFKRLEVDFSNSISDYLRAGASLATGSNSGGTDSVPGFFLGSDAALSVFANIEVCELWIFNVLPTPEQLALLDSYATNRYGVSVIV
jgi:hypothetical protein